MLPSSSSVTFPSFTRTFSSHSKKHKLFSSSSKKPSSSFICLRIGVEEIAEIAHNKVLVAAAVASAIGQFSKPFTSSILYRRAVNFKAVIQAGGMPSTHSAGVVAVATSLGLERGFSDSIFGMSVVFAAFVMYDAQGVRREAGYHAKILNRMIEKKQEKAIPIQEKDELIDSKQGTSSIAADSLSTLFSLSEESRTPNATAPIRTSENAASRPTTMKSLSSVAVNGEQAVENAYSSYLPLKESVGHTEIEVVVGAFLGFLVSLAVYSIA
ncbi:uncharacterized protein LOC131240874 isoform X1 [Magnolia sinica]|uniref:uncharacterized protein LOC131240874 isoform X1 n=1 Tax=Magnolia sinica TaxID=86752 RepID=UPI0026589070|nr:uncharacterized protein LOC131240874 isoform X1 [Magnolia sinica]